MAAGKKTGGRQKGSINKTTAAVKDNVLAVFNRLNGTSGMAEWANENKTEFYKIYAKLIPAEMKNEIVGAEGGPIQHKIEVVIVDASSPSTP